MAGDITAPVTANPSTGADTTRVPGATEAVPPRELSPIELTSNEAAATYGVGRIVNAEA